MKSSYGGPIGTHERSFERYHPGPPTTFRSPRLGSRPQPKTVIAIISGTGKATNFKFCSTLLVSIGTKAHDKLREK